MASPRASGSERGKKAAPHLTDGHKQALAEGRRAGAAVRRYLDMLVTRLEADRNGHHMTPEQIEARIQEISEEFPKASSIEQLRLVQERVELLAELKACTNVQAWEAAESDFIKYAKGYADRKGISFEAWRTIGVSREVLERAGITAESHPVHRRLVPRAEGTPARRTRAQPNE